MKMILILLFIWDIWRYAGYLKNAKQLKKDSKELMSVAGHHKKWWNFCLSEDEKQEIEPVFTEKCF